MKIRKKHSTIQKREQALLLYYNKGLSNEKIACLLNCSVRTVIRWKKAEKDKDRPVCQKENHTRKRKKIYSEAIFTQILALKQENPARTGSGIHRLLLQQFPTTCPSVSTIRKFLNNNGYFRAKQTRKEGYVKFERSKPNDLWQIDIAGVQTVGHLGKLYLIAILDDCSRFVVAAQYFPSQMGINVLSVVRNAIMKYGRPNQIIADNGTQFRNVTKDIGNRYIHLLTSLDIQPIYSRPYHPQSKGKLERWFGTVKQMFLPDARFNIKQDPGKQLYNFNEEFAKWLEWYNYQKPHRSLPSRKPPNTRFFQKERIYRPLESLVDWNRWINTFYQRKVTKYNYVSFKGENIVIPRGYAGCKVDLLETPEFIEVYQRDKLICTHQKQPLNIIKNQRREFRTIAQSGTIQYQKSHYTIDYKLARKKVEIKEAAGGQELLIYLDSILIKRLSRK